MTEREPFDWAERTCTHRFLNGEQCAALPVDEVHTSATCEFGHAEAHHEFAPPLNDPAEPSDPRCAPLTSGLVEGSAGAPSKAASPGSRNPRE